MSRVAVVTGAAGQIGSATCRVLEEDGWSIIPVDRLPIDHPDSIELDIGDAEGIASKLGGLSRVDGLVNNAAEQLYKPLMETTVEEWDRILAVNLRGAFACVKAVGAQLADSGGGAVVNVASVHAAATSVAMAAYASSKGGLVAFTRAAAMELAPLGVRVNAILPGAVDSPALRDGFRRREGAERTLLDRTPLGRVGRPTEIGRAIKFLLDSEQAGYLTGASFVADGGALARLSTE